VPALRGSLTYARFFVEGELPDDFRERFMKAIRLRAMTPLEATDEDLERSGWCAVGDPFALDLAYDDVFFNEYVNLGLRTDRWVIPGATLRAKLREAEEAYLTKKGRERLTRKEKAELKELVSRRLRRQTTPQTRAVDVSWSLEDGLIRFFSHAPKAAARLAEVFQKTFGGHGLSLVAESPYTLAARLGLSKAEVRAWDELEVTVLAEEEEA
jgi:recombination associated protein RdgC